MNAGQRYDLGDRVRIDDRREPRHHRTPAFVKGQTGIVTRVCMDQAKPEDVAYFTMNGPRVPVYRIRMMQCDLWPDYTGKPDDTLDIEMHGHWLQPA